jgi:PTS system nitrogen regulatory IIA component
MTLSVRDVARLLGVSEKTVYRWVASQNLPAYRVSGQYRFARAEVLEWATANRVNVTPALLVEPAAESGELPGLATALDAGGIYYRVEGRDRDHVLRSVVANLRLPPEIDRTFLFEVLRAREMIGSTAIGRGIAIPHPRNPVVLHLAGPTVSLCFLEEPIDFGALDGQPVTALFVILSRTVRAHLHLLSRLAFSLQDPAFARAVSTEAGRETILAEARRIDASLPAPRAAAPEHP